jgi:hypothetical protein
MAGTSSGGGEGGDWADVAVYEMPPGADDDDDQEEPTVPYRVPRPVPAEDDEPTTVRAVLYRHGVPCLVTFLGGLEVDCTPMDTEHGAIARLLGGF